MQPEALMEWAQRLELPAGQWGRLLLSIGLIVVLALVRVGVVRLIQRNVDDHAVRYRLAKLTTYATLALAAVGLARVWITGLQVLLAIVGLMAAGTVIALQDVVRNLAGGMYIAVRHPLRVGDRIELGGVAGDVVDVGLVGLHVLEIRGWVDADQTTGRVLHLPNGWLFTESLANFGGGFEWIWHEITVPLTFDSDVDRARMILGEVMDAHAPNVPEGGAKQAAPREMLIRFTTLQPSVYVHADERGVRLTGRMRCDIRQRRLLDHRVWSDLLRRLRDEPDITLTYAATRAELGGRIDLGDGAEQPAGPPP